MEKSSNSNEWEWPDDLDALTTAP